MPDQNRDAERLNAAVDRLRRIDSGEDTLLVYPSQYPDYAHVKLRNAEAEMMLDYRAVVRHYLSTLPRPVAITLERLAAIGWNIIPDLGIGQCARLPLPDDDFWCRKNGTCCWLELMDHGPISPDKPWEMELIFGDEKPSMVAHVKLGWHAEMQSVIRAMETFGIPVNDAAQARLAEIGREMEQE